MQLAEQLRHNSAVAHLGPAEVLCSGLHEIDVRLESGPEVAAQLALQYPYTANEGDVVLVIGLEARYFVIGVIGGHGKTMLDIPGDVSLRAIDGTLDLRGDRGLKLHSPEVDLVTGKLRIIADSVVQKCTHAYQRVRELFTFRAGRAHSVVEGTSYAKSKQAVIVSDEKVMINGKQIHLG